jgi:hypothetical protein
MVLLYRCPNHFQPSDFLRFASLRSASAAQSSISEALALLKNEDVRRVAQRGARRSSSFTENYIRTIVLVKPDKIRMATITPERCLCATSMLESHLRVQIFRNDEREFCIKQEDRFSLCPKTQKM